MKQQECAKYFNTEQQEEGEEREEEGKAFKVSTNYEYVFRVLFTVLPLFKNQIIALEKSQNESSVVFIDNEAQEIIDRNFPAIFLIFIFFKIQIVKPYSLSPSTM